MPPTGRPLVTEIVDVRRKRGKAHGLRDDDTFHGSDPGRQEPLEQAIGDHAQSRADVGFITAGGFERAQLRVDLVEDHRLKHARLAAEARVQGPLGDARLFGDHVGTGAVEPVFEEQFAGALEDV